MNKEFRAADAAREQIVARVEAGADLTEVDQSVIEPAPVGEDEKAALWLFAWCASTDEASRGWAR